MVKYNFGGGPKRIEGFKNVDAIDWTGMTDILWDLTKIPYEFVKEPVDEIMAMEILEHISFRQTKEVLREWHRILKVGGKLTIQVPDIGRMCKDYAEKRICDCVPRKATTSMEDFKANPKCWSCGGKGTVNPERWLQAFTGSQKHGWDCHKAVFTREILEENLKEAGFQRMGWKDNIYKLIVVCYK